jgi:hypothetical protein
MCLEGFQGARAPDVFGCSARIYPAVENILLSARALGLGATLTTRVSQSEAGRVGDMDRP